MGSGQVSHGREHPGKPGQGGPNDSAHPSRAYRHGAQGPSCGVGALQEDRKERTIGKGGWGTQKRRGGHKAGNVAQDDGRRATGVSLHLSPKVPHCPPLSNATVPSALLLLLLLLSQMCAEQSLSASSLPAGLERGGE